MDARPFRPRGVENAPQLHQRHKSMGSLAMNAQTSGFRGPAKRAAFGDVTNLAKAIGHGREDAKALKVQNANALVSTTINKENVTYPKDAFTRPAQRPATRPSQGNKALDAVNKPARNSAFEVIGSASYVRRDVQAPKVPTSTEAPALQPRHHKSQPQLKAQQPTLRRTQSRQLEKMVVKSDSTNLDYDDEGTGAQLQDDYDNSQAAYADSLHLSVDQESQVNMPSDERYSDSLKLPEISEEEAMVPVSYQEGPLPPMSEPEECWDEDDDEDFDDQDQAYTTAHSFRSRDLTAGGATTVVLPRVTARVQRELEEAKIEVERTRTEDDIEEELWDVSMVAEYGDEIFEYMRELETKMLPNAHYMDIQTEIQWSMRSVLMDWLVQVHSRFGLLPETLFLTVNYIDRFLSSKVVSIGKLQLVGATAILVASKYEEINCPSLQEIVYMVDNGYTPEEVLKAERFMLSMLGFELGWPGPMSFLRRVSKADDYDLDTRTLAKYFLELTIMDERFVASPPSFLAAGAHCLSRFILNKGDWTKQHVHYSGYTWSQLRSLVSMMLECCEHPQLHHAAIFDKYTDRRYKEASLLVQHALETGFKLPHQQGLVGRVSSQPAAYYDHSAEVSYSHGQLVPIEG